MSKYDEIINISHFDPVNHKRMSIMERAAQFSSFAALTGYSESVKETARLTFFVAIVGYQLNRR